MLASPGTLQELCVDFITEGHQPHCLFYKDQARAIQCLHSNIAHPLFEALGHRGMTDRLLSFFHSDRATLKSVCIEDASKITCKGLRVLRSQKLNELIIVGLKNATVNDLIGCLGDQTPGKLRLLNVSHSTFLNSEKVRVVIALSKLKSLTSLDVSYTEFNSRGLEIVATDLPLLDSLNISGTMVSDITPLKKCKERLKVLSMFNLKAPHNGKYVSVLSELSLLRHLDISDDNDPYTASHVNCIELSEFLQGPMSLPHLISLDVSGKKCLKFESLKTFLLNHQSLQFLGLMENEICEMDRFRLAYDLEFNKSMLISGYACEEQVMESLRRYRRRKSFLQKSLCYLYSDIQYLEEPRIDMIDTVLRGMRNFPEYLGIQMAATACLYNLTKNNLSAKIHVVWLKKIINATLVAMESFPKQQQLQKNALLTLCSDRMLQDVNFDRYRCAQLVMNSLMKFDDPAMNRMSVAICSILAARISTSETSDLGSKFPYMRKLLTIVKTKTDQGDIDIMMKFTLSALWNLTDESPKTCNVFLDSGGLNLFHNVLKKFAGERTVETKVLGLINNIAEVSKLRQSLMEDSFIETLGGLMFSEHIDVSYFAAGIIANLAFEGEEKWFCENVSFHEMVQKLGDSVLNWKEPEIEMVAYRSFFPFYQLLFCFKAYQVQMWAVWAIHHVCVKNPKRYCKMVFDEHGYEFLISILNSEKPPLNEFVAHFAYDILVLMKGEYPNQDFCVRGKPVNSAPSL